MNTPVEEASIETATDPALPAFALKVRVEADVILLEITLARSCENVKAELTVT
jgi:hypothetical protein